MRIKLETPDGGVRTWSGEPEFIGFTMADGHVSILRFGSGGFNDIVAVFAPGEWVSVEREDEQ